MFESITTYMVIGVLAGLVGALLLFRRWDLPGYIKKRFKLYTRVKCLLFIFLSGAFIAFCLTMLMGVLGLPAVAAELIEGVMIGFFCAMIPTFMRPKDDYKTKGGGHASNAASSAPDKRGRRSKG